MLLRLLTISSLSKNEFVTKRRRMKLDESTMNTQQQSSRRQSKCQVKRHNLQQRLFLHQLHPLSSHQRLKSKSVLLNHRIKKLIEFKSMTLREIKTLPQLWISLLTTALNLSIPSTSSGQQLRLAN